MDLDSDLLELIWYCGGTGTDSSVPTNTVQVPITTGTVTDSGSECTVKSGNFAAFF